MKLAVSILTAVCALFAAAAVAADDYVGNIKTISGDTSIIRNNTALKPAIGEKIYLNDVLKTGPESSAGMVFKDDTLLSLGPDSRVTITEFLFSPSDNKLSLVMKMFNGTVVYLSGIIAKLAPNAVKFETPVANIGVRGTKFAVRIEGENPPEQQEQKASADPARK
jgi:hypothetical protein